MNRIADGRAPVTRANVESIINDVEFDGLLQEREVEALERASAAVYEGKAGGTTFGEGLLANYANDAARLLREKQREWASKPFGFVASTLEMFLNPLGFRAPKPDRVSLDEAERSIKDHAWAQATLDAMAAANVSELVRQYPTAVEREIFSSGTPTGIVATDDVQAEMRKLQANIRAGGAFDDRDILKPLREYLEEHHPRQLALDADG